MPHSFTATLAGLAVWSGGMVSKNVEVASLFNFDCQFLSKTSGESPDRKRLGSSSTRAEIAAFLVVTTSMTEEIVRDGA